MSEPADDGDILGWELDQLAKLKLLKEAYGWDEEDPKYKAKLKQVQQLGNNFIRVWLPAEEMAKTN